MALEYKTQYNTTIDEMKKLVSYNPDTGESKQVQQRIVNITEVTLAN